MKLLLWLAIGFAVIWLLRNKKNRLDTGATPYRHAGSDSVRVEPMIRCVRCGVHIPASEAVRDASGDVFCSEEHRQKHFSS